jgi:hypothetical protein
LDIRQLEKYNMQMGIDFVLLVGKVFNVLLLNVLVVMWILEENRDIVLLEEKYLMR